jgi:glucosamine-6-phosphate deaminase
MEIVICRDAAAIGALVADAVVDLLDRRPSAVLGLATGSSPIPVYDELVARHQRGEVTFARVEAFCLDEYVGLPVGHPESYRSVIERAFTGRVDFPDGSVHAPDGGATDIPAACDEYERAIVGAGGVDLQLLGVGADGHIGFNEPGSSLASRTRLKTLTGQTRRDNARFFGGEDLVPRHVLTQGIATILDARHLVLIAIGASKAEPIAAAVEGPVTAMIPASALQLHPHVTVILDEAAAGGLRLAAYYREAYAGKPSWQRL